MRGSASNSLSGGEKNDWTAQRVFSGGGPQPTSSGRDRTFAEVIRAPDSRTSATLMADPPVRMLGGQTGFQCAMVRFHREPGPKIKLDLLHASAKHPAPRSSASSPSCR